MEKIFKGWNKFEIILLFMATVIITTLSIYWGDNWIGVLSALTGVVCVVLTAKGKISCYAFGIINCIAYAYIAYEAKYYGDVMENLIYFLPMQFVGIAAWRKNINKETGEVRSKVLAAKDRVVLTAIAAVAVLLYGKFLQSIGGNLPYMDSLSNILSLAAMWLSVKRYVEQWIMWIIIDVVTVGMWIVAVYNGSGDVATLLMWSVYLINAVYGFIKWNKNSKMEELQ